MMPKQSPVWRPLNLKICHHRAEAGGGLLRREGAGASIRGSRSESDPMQEGSVSYQGGTGKVILVVLHKRRNSGSSKMRISSGEKNLKGAGRLW